MALNMNHLTLVIGQEARGIMNGLYMLYMLIFLFVTFLPMSACQNIKSHCCAVENRFMNREHPSSHICSISDLSMALQLPKESNAFRVHTHSHPYAQIWLSFYHVAKRRKAPIIESATNHRIIGG